MSTRKSAAERVESYRALAAQIEEKERRKLLGRSPQWMATKRALANIELAQECIAGLEDDESAQLRISLEVAHYALAGCRADRIGAAPESGA